MDRPFVIFISSVIDDDPSSKELKTERDCVEKCIGSMSPLATPWAFEKKPASAQDVQEFFTNGVQNCDIFVLLLDQTLSEGVKLEYETAIATRKPILTFIKKGQKHGSLNEFLEAFHVKYKQFSSVEELKRYVREAIFTEMRARIPPDWKADQMEAANELRNKRVKNIGNNNTFVPFVPGAKIILHLIPRDSLTSNKEHAMAALEETARGILPILHGVGKRKPTSEGFISYSLYDDKISDSYIMLCRNGILEAVGAVHISSDARETPMRSNAVAVPPFERELKRLLPEYLATLKKLGIKLPIYLFLAFTGIKGTALWYGFMSVLGAEEVSIDPLFIKPQQIEKYDDQEHLLEVLRKCFDEAANASGCIRSPTFSEDFSQ